MVGASLIVVVYREERLLAVVALGLLGLNLDLLLQLLLLQLLVHRFVLLQLLLKESEVLEQELVQLRVQLFGKRFLAHGLKSWQIGLLNLGESEVNLGFGQFALSFVEGHSRLLNFNEHFLSVLVQLAHLRLLVVYFISHLGGFLLKFHLFHCQSVQCFIKSVYNWLNLTLGESIFGLGLV